MESLLFLNDPLFLLLLYSTIDFEEVRWNPPSNVILMNIIWIGKENSILCYYKYIYIFGLANFRLTTA